MKPCSDSLPSQPSPGQAQTRGDALAVRSQSQILQWLWTGFIIGKLATKSQAAQLTCCERQAPKNWEWWWCQGEEQKMILMIQMAETVKHPSVPSRGDQGRSQSCLHVSSMDTGGQWFCQKKTCYWLLILSFTLEKAVVQQYKAESKTWMQSTAIGLGHSNATLANTTLSNMAKQDFASLFPKACTYPTHGKPPDVPEEHMLIPAQH